MNVEDCLFVCIELLMLKDILSIVQFVLSDIVEGWSEIKQLIDVAVVGIGKVRDLPVVIEKLSTCQVSTSFH